MPKSRHRKEHQARAERRRKEIVHAMQPPGLDSTPSGALPRTWHRHVRAVGDRPERVPGLSPSPLIAQGPAPEVSAQQQVLENMPNPKGREH